MSSYIIVAVGGGSLGLLVGGYVTQALSWHWIFFINMPIGIVTFVIGNRCYRRKRRTRDPGRVGRRRRLAEHRRN